MSGLRAKIGYSARTEQRPYFYANAHEKDFVPLAPVEVDIADARGRDCSLDREGFTLVEHRSALAEDAGLTPAQLALHWVLSRGDHVHVIPGTTSLQHLEDNHRASDIPVADDVLAQADALINEHTIAGHRYHEAIRPTIDTEEFEPA